jgi:autotransporter-associated beta strand protein
MKASRASVLCFAAILILSMGLMSQFALADSFNWQGVNGSNWNSTVKSQFSLPPWAFAACASLEAKYMLTRNDPSFVPDVSEQQLVWEWNGIHPASGDPDQWALDYLTTHGVVSESECPVSASSPDSGVPPYWPLASGWQNRVWKSASNVNNITNVTNTMKLYLKEYGPMEVGCSASNDLYSSLADLETNYRGPVSNMDHCVSLVGYADNAGVPSGGYWIVKNSWGTGGGVNGSGYYYIPYNDIEAHSDINAITGAVSYTGAMKSVTWTGVGAAGPIWTAATGSAYYNFSDHATWVNQETAATFDATASNRTIEIINPVIAHQMIFNASGYSLNNGSNGALTVTAGGIQANQSVTINVPVTVGAPQTWTTASGMTLNVTAALHTVISNLTISGAGNTIIAGPIDGGGVLNTNGGAAPGNLIKNGAGTLTLSGASNYPGTIAINAGVLSLAPVSGATANYSGAISGSGALQKNGAGKLVLSGANNYSGLTTVTAGTLELAATARNPVLNLGGADIQGGKIVFDYAGAADPVATIRGLLAASCDGGRWDVGQFKDSTATATGLTLGIFDDTSSHQVKVMATYPGDFNLDGVVDNLDRSIWFANAFTGTTWQQGDANGDGVVDGRDRDIVFAHAGLSSLAAGLPAAGSTPAPEPGTLALLAAGLIGLLVSAWRKRK